MSPRIKFFTELDHEELITLFENDNIIDQVKKLGASIALGLLDLSSERAALVSRLNQAGIPVTAWMLLSKEDGYWFNLYNSSQACTFYEAFRDWQAQYHLQFEALGIDIQPDIRDMRNLALRRWRTLPVLIWRALDRKRYLIARQTYRNLIGRMRADGFFVESYQYPLIVEERLVRSTLLQRMLGIVDLPVNREVLMLYSSFFRPNGVGILWSYAAEAGGIGIGSTGGGSDYELIKPLSPPLDWEEFARDLRLSWYWTDSLYVFSLEGCWQQGFLDRLESFKWDEPIIAPISVVEKIERFRQIIRSFLWMSAHLPRILLLSTAIFLLMKGIQRWVSNPEKPQEIAEK